MNLLVCLISLVIAMFHYTKGCNLIVSTLNVQILGNGFHKKVAVESSHSSSSRFTNCELMYLFQIPSEAYVDYDNVESNRKYSFFPIIFGAEEEARVQQPFYARLRKTKYTHLMSILNYHVFT